MAETKSVSLKLDMILFLIFLVLKLTDNIDWSWWWVTSPLWLPAVFVIVFGIVVIVGESIRNAFRL
jgi:hypothetical protein